MPHARAKHTPSALCSQGRRRLPAVNSSLSGSKNGSCLPKEVTSAKLTPNYRLPRPESCTGVCPGTGCTCCRNYARATSGCPPTPRPADFETILSIEPLKVYCKSRVISAYLHNIDSKHVTKSNEINRIKLREGDTLINTGYNGLREQRT